MWDPFWTFGPMTGFASTQATEATTRANAAVLAVLFEEAGDAKGTLHPGRRRKRRADLPPFVDEWHTFRARPAKTVHEVCHHPIGHRVRGWTPDRGHDALEVPLRAEVDPRVPNQRHPRERSADSDRLVDEPIPLHAAARGEVFLDRGGRAQGHRPRTERRTGGRRCPRPWTAR